MKLFLSICLSLVIYQAHSQTSKIELKVVDEYDQPIDGVYVQINAEVFTYSNNDGILNIPNKAYTDKDSISFSHLSYFPIKYSVRDLKRLKESPVITLESNIRELKEVVVTNINAKDYVAEAIKLLPENYGYAFNPSAYFNANISLTNNDDNSKLIDYKGGIVLFLSDKKNLLVSKIPEYENVVDNLQDYIYQIKPYNFTSIIAIGSHPVIRKYKEYTYPKYEYISYKGLSALKIYFEIDKKHGGQSGYMIINREDKAILSLSYSINPIKDWIRAKTKKGMENVSLDYYYVEADYSKNENDKYIFDSGRERIVLRNTAGKKKANTTSEVYLKRIYKTINPDEKIEIKYIF
jgi:hypothetical protein